MPRIFDVGRNLLRVVSFAPVASGHEEAGETPLRVAMEIIAGAAANNEHADLAVGAVCEVLSANTMSDLLRTARPSVVESAL